MAAKMGRPKAENPKTVKFSIRLDTETNAALENYCKAHNLSKGEALRRGLALLFSQTK